MIHGVFLQIDLFSPHLSPSFSPNLSCESQPRRKGGEKTPITQGWSLGKNESLSLSKGSGSKPGGLKPVRLFNKSQYSCKNAQAFHRGDGPPVLKTGSPGAIKLVNDVSHRERHTAQMTGTGWQNLRSNSAKNPNRSLIFGGFFWTEPRAISTI
ncbi:MAG: hypothetical protein CM15mP45_03720 [Deltaproteobacteria bacterium]|nr:MAG: hypothetical protein CM15mP45_03720 [Deltaproteobacteria bacterium]